jgi:succinate dehydrogenase / fumarate reductase cytochrome b subunit
MPSPRLCLDVIPAEQPEAAVTASIRSRHFLARRVHSLLGLIPVGGFLLFHLWENSQSRFGTEHYNEYVVEKIRDINYVVLLEIFLIAVPILFHGIYGVIIWLRGSSNVTTYGFFRNWMWWLQRISGVAVLLFLIVHVGGTRIVAIWDDGIAEDMFGHMESLFSNPLYLTGYLFGLVLSIFHLCNGLWSMSIVWGLTTTERSQKTVQGVTGLMFVVLTALGVHGVVGFLIA